MMRMERSTWEKIREAPEQTEDCIFINSAVTVKDFQPFRCLWRLLASTFQSTGVVGAAHVANILPMSTKVSLKLQNVPFINSKNEVSHTQLVCSLTTIP